MEETIKINQMDKASLMRRNQLKQIQRFISHKLSIPIMRLRLLRENNYFS